MQPLYNIERVNLAFCRARPAVENGTVPASVERSRHPCPGKEWCANHSVHISTNSASMAASSDWLRSSARRSAPSVWCGNTSRSCRSSSSVVLAAGSTARALVSRDGRRITSR
uniref:Uncharacterized protein n=1 Tax=Chrysotila carterae TaxID=13221 RepID=A0A7S4EW47_CHRCT